MRPILSFLVLSLATVAGDPVYAQIKKKAPALGIVSGGKTLTQIFDELLPGMGAADLGARSGPQQAWQRICFDASAPGKDKMRREVCALMAAKLGSDVPKPARVWLLQQLQRIGGEECIEKVTAAATDKELQVREEALRCLANIPSRNATGRLVSLLPSADASAKIGVLNALGHRQDHQAIPAIAGELAGKETAVVQAAARALGRMPAPESITALVSARGMVPTGALAAVNDAYLSCADYLLQNGNRKEALAMYQELFKPSTSKATRLGALLGVLKCSGDDAGALILDILRAEDTPARQVAIAYIENLNAQALKTVGQQLERLPNPSQVMVLSAMAARGDRSLASIAVKAAASKNDAVARAGIQALGKLGDASVVRLLLDKAAAKSPLSATALDSLAQIPGDEVNQQLIALLGQAKPSPSAVQIIEVLGRRKALSAIPALLQKADHADAAIRAAAFASLGAVAEPKDAKPMIAAFLKFDKKGAVQAAAAIVTVCAREPDPEKRADPVLTVFSNERTDMKAKDSAALLLLMGRLGGKRAYKQVTAFLASDVMPVSDAAHEALFNWPDDAAAFTLLKIAQDAKATPRGRTAIRSLARVCAVPGGAMPVDAKLDMLKKAMTCADRDDERRVILEHIGLVRHIDTLRLVVPYLDDKALSQSACRAVVELAHSRKLRMPNQAEFRRALDRVIATSTDELLRERARDYKRQQ
jgi:HEAT repeat protein